MQDDPGWHSAADDSNEDAGAGELYDPGQEYLDRLALSLGGKAVSDAASPLLSTWLADPSWQKRAAVFICLAQIAEGCAKVGPRCGGRQLCVHEPDHSIYCFVPRQLSRCLSRLLSQVRPPHIIVDNIHISGTTPMIAISNKVFCPQLRLWYIYSVAV